MHSNLVELLKRVLVESVYFGFMNSEIPPLVYCKTSSNSWSEKTRVLILPGKTLLPSASTGSFSKVEDSKELSWLYSTLIVKDLPSMCLSAHIAPIASPGFLGIVIELTSKFLDLLTPRTAGSDLKARGLVS